MSLVKLGIPELAAGATGAQEIEAKNLNLKDLKAKNYLFQTYDCDTTLRNRLLSLTQLHKIGL